MRNLLITLIFSMLALSGWSQLNNFLIKTVGNTSPTGRYYAQYLPAGFDTAVTDCGYPMIIFLHGLGEKGPNDGSQLGKVTTHGPPKHIKNGHNMCFTVNGKTECFVVVSPQLSTGNWTPEWVASIYNDVLADTAVGSKIDTNRVYLTGLSLGGMGTYWHMINTVHNNPNRWAAFAPIAGIASPSIGCQFSALNVPMWAFHGDQDNVVSYTQDTTLFYNIINCTSPAPQTEFKFTTYAGVGHNSWSRAYNTGHTYHNPNLYEWLLTKKHKMTTSGCTGMNNINLNSSVLCVGDTIKAWSNTANINDYYWEYDTITFTDSFIEIIPDTGLHEVKLTVSNCECTSDTTVTILVNPLPESTIQLSGAPDFCLGDSIILSSDTSFGNTWSVDGNFVSNNQSITAKSTGLYSLLVTENGCESSDDVFITAFVPAKPSLTQNGDTLTSSSALSYQWFLNGSKLNGDTSRSMKPAITGNYSVVTVDSNGCSSESDSYFYEVGVIPGISGAVKLPEFQVFPNPFVDEFTIEFKEDYTEIREVILIDVRGSIVLSEKIIGSVTIVKRGNLSTGMYTLGFRSSDGNFLNTGLKLMVH